MNLQKELYSKLQRDKIGWNKRTITMELFLSFLTVPVTRSHDHLGSNNGWTKLFNTDVKLEVSGANVGGVEYLDNLQYGHRLGNPYNNYVNPFFMFDILTDEGKKFFLEYYRDDIEKIKSDAWRKIERLSQELEEAKKLVDDIDKEITKITPE